MSPDETIEPGQTTTHDYHLFLGPKVARPARAVRARATSSNTAGSGGLPGRCPRCCTCSTRLVHNYGLAIILLTVLVRGAMFPIGRKAALNAQKMQELAPEIKKIKEKYKNDLEKQGQAQRELWKKHNFNPLGGCWLMFLQLPIFIGLYRCLSVDIELRQAPLIPGVRWCSNLAGPDMVWRWQGTPVPTFLASETGWLGTVSEHPADHHDRAVHLAAEDVHAAGHRRTDAHAAEDDAVHDDLHGVSCSSKSRPACACTSSPRVCGASANASCCRRPTAAALTAGGAHAPPDEPERQSLLDRLDAERPPNRSMISGRAARVGGDASGPDGGRWAR